MTAWVDHSERRWTEIEDLKPDKYEFKTVARNKVGMSAESDLTFADLENAETEVVGENSCYDFIVGRIPLSLSLSFSLKIFPMILLTIYHIFLIMLFVRIWSKVKQFSLVDIFLSSNQLSSRQCGDIARRIHLLIPLGSEWRVKAALNTLLWVLVGHTWSRFVWRGSEKNGKLC